MVKQDSRTKLTNALKPRPMTIGGLCTHLGISEATWRRWRKSPDLADMVDRIEGIIRLQKSELAAAGELDGRMISRDLGLADKKVIAASGQDAQLERYTAACEEMSEDQLWALDFLLKSGPGDKFEPPAPAPKLLEHERAEKPAH